MTRPRGAPKGNLNALKHGFYSRLFRSSESNDLTEDEAVNLENEINLLRVMMRRTIELADGIDDIAQATKVLVALGAAAGRLASLIRTQRFMNEKHSQAVDEISIAIQRVNEELRKKYG
jgi:methyl-accepting chemotaxis protein